MLIMMDGMEFMYTDPTVAMQGQGVMSSGMEVLMIFCAVLGVALALLMLVSQWKVFQKAKLPGWGILIPIYNVYLMFKLAGKPGWTWWLLLPPVAGILAIVAQFKIAKKFGKGDGFAIGLWLLPIVFYPMLAFGKDVEYHPEA